MADAVKPGDAVRLHGLQSEEGQRMNGQVGVAAKFIEDKGRWAVHIGGKAITFKEANLQVVPEDDPAAKAARDLVPSSPSAGGNGFDAFMTQEQMLAHLEQMGMPRAVVEGLEPEKIQKMFQMTKDPAIMARAQAARAAAVADDKSPASPSNSGNSTKPGSGSKSGLSHASGPLWWKDGPEDVSMEVRLTSEQSGKVACKISGNRLSVSVGKVSILDSELFQEVDPKKSNWLVVEDGGNRCVELQLSKKTRMRWLMPTR